MIVGDVYFIGFARVIAYFQEKVPTLEKSKNKVKEFCPSYDVVQ